LVVRPVELGRPLSAVLLATRLSSLLLFGVAPLLLYARVLWAAPPLVDFQVFWGAGQDVLAGRSPYPPLEAAALASEHAFVYPAPAALAMVPWALLPYQAAEALFALVLLAAVAATLAVLGVRDWRCYGAAFLWVPVLNASLVGAVGPLLALGVALAWRYRGSAVRTAMVVAAVVVAKVFLWPLVLWLAATRRLRAAALAAVAATVTTLVGWAILGFAGFRDYPRMLSMLADALQDLGFSPMALGLALGAPPDVARGLTLAVGGLALVAIFVLARRVGDRAALSAALVSALLLSPIVWPHYFVLLLVPLALARPRFDPVWLLPLAWWAIRGQSEGVAWEIVVGLGVALALAGFSAFARPGGHAHALR
jgi:alpha-1,2-mannosyltransferase